MKRYLLFVGDFYYPAGGWNDYKGCYATLEEAKDAGFKLQTDCSWAHIVDINAGEIVFK